MATSSEENFLAKCKVPQCTEKPEIICLTCGDQPFCEEHKKVHDLICSDHELVDYLSYTTDLMEDRSAQYCTQHSNIKISLACINCHEPMCRKCMDQKSSERCPDRKHVNESHLVRSLDLVANTIQKRMKDKMGELKAYEVQVADQLQDVQKTLDVEFEDDRSKLDLIKTKVNEMRVCLDEMEKTLIAQLTDNMKQKQKDLKLLEGGVAAFQEKCQKCIDETAEFNRKSDAVLVRKYKCQEKNLTELFDAHIAKYVFGKLELKSKELEIQEAISLRTTATLSVVIKPHTQNKLENAAVTDKLNNAAATDKLENTAGTDKPNNAALANKLSMPTTTIKRKKTAVKKAAGNSAIKENPHRTSDSFNQFQLTHSTNKPKTNQQMTGQPVPCMYMSGSPVSSMPSQSLLHPSIHPPSMTNYYNPSSMHVNHPFLPHNQPYPYYITPPTTSSTNQQQAPMRDQPSEGDRELAAIDGLEDL